MSFLIEIFHMELLDIFDPFEMNGHTVETLGWSCGGIVWRKWLAISGVGNCHTRHFRG